jgi:tetratricopeptide (TPR) repeat protein
MDARLLAIGLQDAQQQMLAFENQAQQLAGAGRVQEAAQVYAGMVPRLRELVQMGRQVQAQGVPTFDVAGIARQRVRAALHYADALETLGQAGLAIPPRAEAMQVAATLVGEAGVAEVELSLAGSLQVAGRFHEALGQLTRAQERVQRTGQPFDAIQALLDLSGFYQWMGDGTRALEAVTQARALVPKPSGRRFTTDDLEGLLAVRGAPSDAQLQQAQDGLTQSMLTRVAVQEAFVHRVRGDHAAARQSIQEARSGLRQKAVDLGLDFQEACLDILDGRPAEGLGAMAELATQAAADDNLRPKLPVFLRWGAEAMLALGQVEDALDVAQKTQGHLQRAPSTDVAWRVAWLTARIHDARGDRAAALAACQEAVRLVGTLRLVPLGPRLDNTFLSDKMPLYEHAILLAADLGDAQACVRLMEEVKARTAAFVMGAVPRAASPLQARFEELSRQVDGLEYTLDSDASRAPAAQARKAALLAERDHVLEAARALDPAWRRISAARFDLDEVLDALAGRGAAALALHYVGTEMVCVLLHDWECRVQRFPLPDAVVEGLNAYTANLEAPESEQDGSFFDPSVAGIGAGHFVPAGFLDEALQAEALLVVPFGELHLLPWGGMVHNGRHLFESTPVSVLPSLAALPTFLGDEEGSLEGVAIVGDPAYPARMNLRKLASAAAEVEEVRKVYADAGRAAEVFPGRKATGKALRGLVGEHAEARSLHLACHGSIDPENPMASGLLLADERIDAAEVSQLRLPYQDVVLSACNTGWRGRKVGDVPLYGDDVLGLPGAFLEAGARNVVVSIPLADDKVARLLMVRYHAARVAGSRPARALAAAQAALLEEQPEHTADIVGFTVYGAP